MASYGACSVLYARTAGLVARQTVLAASGILLILISFVPTCDLRFTLRLLTSGLGALYENAC